uniref:Uncharacterized protein n=1 Tax=Solanum lycopersicum TaxID=4081 RepID=A0A3Q7HRV0_SOLLC
MKVTLNFRYGKQRKTRHIFNIEVQFFKIRKPPPQPCIHIIEVFSVAKVMECTYPDFVEGSYVWGVIG